MWDAGYRPVQIRIGGSKVWFVRILGIDCPYWKNTLKSKMKFIAKKKKFTGEASGVVCVLCGVYKGLGKDATGHDKNWW